MVSLNKSRSILLFFILLILPFCSAANQVHGIVISDPSTTQITTVTHIINNTNGDQVYLNLTGTNANQNINIGAFNFTSSFVIGDGRLLTNVPTFNATYAIWAYNQTFVSSGTFNATYAGFAYNQSSWNVSGTNIFPRDISLNVGIGTSSPTHTLNVVGGVNITINATLAENLFVNTSSLIIGGNNPVAFVEIRGTRLITPTTATSFQALNAIPVLNITGGIGGNSSNDSVTDTARGGQGAGIFLTSGMGGSADNAVNSAFGGAGGNIIIKTGDGGNVSAPNVINGLQQGGSGGTITFTTGNGGKANGNSTSVGILGGTAGGIAFTTGIPSGSGDKQNGIGGAVISFNAGTGGTATTGSQTAGGGTGGGLTFTGGTGGTVTDATTGGNGGVITISSGATSTVSQKNSSVGTSGAITFTPGTARNSATGGGNGGSSGAITFSARNGGSSSGWGLGGNGSSFTVTTGNGAVATINASGNYSGYAGDIQLTTGNGAAGGLSNTSGGSFYFLAGSGAGNATNGSIVLGCNKAGTCRGNIGIGTTTPSYLLDVIGTINATAYQLNDNLKFSFGAAQSATIQYDGTNFLINPKSVGSGKLILQGDLNVSSQINTTSLCLGTSCQTSWNAYGWAIKEDNATAATNTEVFFGNATSIYSNISSSGITFNSSSGRFAITSNGVYDVWINPVIYGNGVPTQYNLILYIDDKIVRNISSLTAYNIVSPLTQPFNWIGTINNNVTYSVRSTGTSIILSNSSTMSIKKLA